MTRRLCPLEQKLLDVIDNLFKYLFKNKNPLINIISLCFICINIYFHSKSCLVVTTPLFALLNITLYFWIKTLKKQLAIILSVTLAMFIVAFLSSDYNYLYIFDKLIKNKLNVVTDANFIGPEKISPTYIFPFVEELYWKFKEDLFFNKKPFTVTKVIVVLVDDSAELYKLRPVYVLFIKNIGKQTIEIEKIDWLIMSKKRRDYITPPTTKYPTLFPGTYFYLQYAPDPAGAYEDEITLTLDSYYKIPEENKESREVHKRIRGVVAYNGIRESHYKFNFIEQNE